MNKFSLLVLTALASATACFATPAATAEATPTATVPTATVADSGTPPVVTKTVKAKPAAAKTETHAITIKIDTDAKHDKAGKTPDDATADAADAPEDDAADDDSHHHHGDSRVAIGHDSTLAAGEHASAVVSVLGSSTSAGEVDDAVVSVLGDTRVTGPVGDAAVAVLGSTYVDSHVGDSAVAVFGNLELGPHAVVDGDVVVVGGELQRDPAAIVHGEVNHVQMFGHMGNLEWLHSWVRHCLVYGRPLAFAPHLGWAWTLALGFLAFYLLLALLFPKGINECVRTMEDEPGRSVLTALFTILLTPILFALATITVILFPFLVIALFIAVLFGKAVVLAWLGRRVIPNRGPDNEPLPVLAVLIGGLIVLVLYVVPVLGFVAYKGFDILGFGIVVYTLLRRFRASRAANSARQAPPAASAATASEPLMAAAPASASAADSVAGATPAAEAPAPAAPAGTAAPAAKPTAASFVNAERAGFWIRMVALLLDLVLVGIVCSIIGVHGDHILLALAAYGAVVWKLKGTTIGGTICNLRVVRLDGRETDWPTAIARALGCFLSMAAVGLGFLWVVFDDGRQSWHDKIAGTVVVRTPRGTALV